MTLRQRSSRWVAVGLCVIAVVVVARAPILRTVASGLVVDESPRDGDCAIILGGDRRYPVIADMFQQNRVRRVLLVKDRASRLVRYGILRHGHEIAREQLLKSGVPEDAIDLADWDTRDAWQLADRLNTWLNEHPNASLLGLEDRFSSRRLRFILDSALDGDNARRVRLLALPDRRYSEDNWWQTRTGLRSLLDAYLSLGYAWVMGPSGSSYEDKWDPDRYEADLRRAAADPDYLSTRGIGFQPVSQERQARCLSHFSFSRIIQASLAMGRESV